MRRESNTDVRVGFKKRVYSFLYSFKVKVLGSKVIKSNSDTLTHSKSSIIDMKKTVVLGATPDPSRFAFKASRMLLEYGHEIVPVGIKKGEISGITIRNDQPPIEDVDTITMYIGTRNQPPLYDYILSLKPKRIIFNPGTENDDLIAMAKKNNIEPVIGCTLVMLSVGSY